MSNLFVQVVQEWGFPQVAPYRWLNATWNLGVNFSQLSSRTTLGPLIMAKDQFRQYLVGAFKYVLFSPRTLGKWSNLTCACFQTGWFNHHLDIVASNIHTKPQKKQNDLAKIPRLGGWITVIKKSLTSDSTILGSLVIMVRHYRSAQEGMTTKIYILCWLVTSACQLEKKLFHWQFIVSQMTTVLPGTPINHGCLVKQPFSI